MEKLFFDTKTKQCVIISEKQLFCSHCKKELPNFFMVQRSYSKILQPRENLFCSACAKHNVKRDLDFFSIVKLETKIKDSYKLISDHAPELRKGELDLFSAANYASEQTEDKTAYANYESWEGAKIGDNSFVEREERKIIYEPELDRFLDNIKNAKPILPKQLENQNV